MMLSQHTGHGCIWLCTWCQSSPFIQVHVAHKQHVSSRFLHTRLVLAFCTTSAAKNTCAQNHKHSLTLPLTSLCVGVYFKGRVREPVQVLGHTFLACEAQ